MTAQPEALRLADLLQNKHTEQVGLQDLEAAAAELRRLHAEVEEQCRLNGMGSEREAKLMAENEALRADAERYRWLRDQTTDDGIAIVMKNKHINDSISYPDNINGYIDAAKGRT